MLSKITGAVVCLVASGAVLARPDLFNADFSLPVPRQGEGNGWVASTNDSNGGWRDTGGNPGGRFILNSSGEAATDPTLQQIVDGFIVGEAYVVMGDYASAILNQSPPNGGGFVVEVASAETGPWTTVFSGNTTAIGDWTAFTSGAFTATARSMWIRMRGEVAVTDNDFQVDNIQVVPRDLRVYLTGGTITGTTNGNAWRRSNGQRADHFMTPASVTLSATGGGGGTSGGLVDELRFIASARCSVGVSILSEGPNTSVLSVGASGEAEFFWPTEYDGSIGSAVLFDHGLYLVIDIPTAHLMYFTLESSGDAAVIQGIRRNGVLVPSGSLLGRGVYEVAQSFSLGASTGSNDNDERPYYDVLHASLRATFVASGCQLPEAVPRVTDEPDDLILCVGGGGALSVVGGGAGPLTYQWRRAGVPLADGASPNGTIFSGTDTPQLTINNLRPADMGRVYDCVVSNACHSTTSRLARVVVCPANFNCDGVVNSVDFFEYLTAFFTAAPRADFNGDSVINSQDFFHFLAAFFAPCP